MFAHTTRHLYGKPDYSEDQIQRLELGMWHTATFEGRIRALIADLDRIFAFKSFSAAWTDEHPPAVIQRERKIISDNPKEITEVITIQYGTGCSNDDPQTTPDVKEVLDRLSPSWCMQAHALVNDSVKRAKEGRRIFLSQIDNELLLRKALSVLERQMLVAKTYEAALRVARHRIHGDWIVIRNLGSRAARELAGQQLRAELDRIVYTDMILAGEDWWREERDKTKDRSLEGHL